MSQSGEINKNLPFYLSLVFSPLPLVDSSFLLMGHEASTDRTYDTEEKHRAATAVSTYHNAFVNRPLTQLAGLFHPDDTIVEHLMQTQVDARDTIGLCCYGDLHVFLHFLHHLVPDKELDDPLRANTHGKTLLQLLWQCVSLRSPNNHTATTTEQDACAQLLRQANPPTPTPENHDLWMRLLYVVLPLFTPSHTFSLLIPGRCAAVRFVYGGRRYVVCDTREQDDCRALCDNPMSVHHWTLVTSHLQNNNMRLATEWYQSETERRLRPPVSEAVGNERITDYFKPIVSRSASSLSSAKQLCVRFAQERDPAWDELPPTWPLSRGTLHTPHSYTDLLFCMCQTRPPNSSLFHSVG
jgi:hypothetical protein